MSHATLDDESDRMEFREAAAFRLTFGKYRGMSLDEIASTDSGLLYLDWLMSTDRPGHRFDYWTGRAMRTYLADETIAADVARLVASRRDA